MPIATLTKNKQTTFYAVTEADEFSLRAVVSEFELSHSGSREYAEHALRVEYLRRLTEHGYDCAQLAHLIQHPPDEEEDLLAQLKLKERLAAKVAKDAIWLRTFDPFIGLLADVAERGDNAFTGLVVRGEPVYSRDDDSWDATERALDEQNPWRRDHFARMEAERAQREQEREAAMTPRERKVIGQFVSMVRSAEKRATMNKTKRRAKTSTKRRAA